MVVDTLAVQLASSYSSSFAAFVLEAHIVAPVVSADSLVDKTVLGKGLGN